ncbi:uncharacterized protein LOC120660228 [Panicum virgatum]|uniref:Uncharacterized protein n=1 Tax=Panicum virgatum TaxID=38727 RepID=A0A8T0VH89_PANVG|nr:uncharacterized protein LOC120660228 [Panicum virgatum]KAG2634118.1 hypothetical protein PVAP13_2NG253400 [Panicum virgatum]
MPSDEPEPLALVPFELQAAAPPPARSGGGKMHRLLRSAFKRGDSASAGSGEEADQLSRSASGSSSSAASSGRPPSGRRFGRRGADGSVDGDRSSRESFELDGSSKNSKLLSALRDAKIGHAYEPFPWEKKMRELLPVPEASCFLSLLLLPKATDVSNTRYSSLEDTLARADAWLRSSQASGVPIVFMNVQTEALLTKISGKTALSTVNMGSLSDLAGMANASLYGFEDYHGVDIGVVRAVRLWYTAAAGEAALELRLRPGDTRLGFAISRTEEGFIYVSSVAEEGTPGVASARSGLLELHRAARAASKLLVVSRVGGEKVLPWMASTAGDVKCFDTVSLSQKLSLHRHALRPITLHFLMWDHDLAAALPGDADDAEKPPPPVLLLSSPLAANKADEIDGGDGPGVAGKDSRDSSFRFQNIGLPDS